MYLLFIHYKQKIKRAKPPTKAMSKKKSVGNTLKEKEQQENLSKPLIYRNPSLLNMQENRFPKNTCFLFWKISIIVLLGIQKNVSLLYI